LEQEGISTVSVVMNRDIADNVKLPRALFVHFPYGAPLGPAHDVETQRSVIRAALELLGTASRAGTIVEADVDWPE
jgi:hypothetical protein